LLTLWSVTDWSLRLLCLGCGSSGASEFVLKRSSSILWLGNTPGREDNSAGAAYKAGIVCGLCGTLKLALWLSMLQVIGT